MPLARVSALAVLAALAAAAMLGLGPPPEVGVRAPAVTDAQRRAQLAFAPGTHPLDQQVVMRAIAQAGPAARRVIDVVDGAVTVRVGPTARAGVAGTTQRRPGGYEVVLDLATVSLHFGQRGITRVVLHELAHVVDDALVPDAMSRQLDAAIPPGYPCTPGEPACAGRSEREERFAESFAKWATGDIGLNLSIGYKVPPPSPLATWGDPLTTLR